MTSAHTEKGETMQTIDKPIWNTGLINSGKMEQVYELAIVKHGHWIGESQTRVDKVFFPSRVFKCSVCGNYLDFDGVNVGRGSANYCPNCGAKMDEVEDEDS